LLPEVKQIFHMPIRCLVALAMMLPMLQPAYAVTVASASGSPSGLCVDAARAAAARYGIPARMMLAITLVETRRQVGGASGPWPWTLNVEGEGFWYETRAEALARAQRVIAGGQRSVDLGCFQLNYRWHGENFATLDDMLEPSIGADYAARFLRQLFDETGDWMRAAGLYHSRTPDLARRYRGLVGRALASLDGAPDPRAATAVTVLPGPRATLGAQGTSAKTEPSPAIILASMGAMSRASTLVAAPGAVALRLFASPARPLLAARGLKP
jgi:hypothetical protein